MKKLLITGLLSAFTLCTTARTLQEAQAEYTDGTIVLSTREEGKDSATKYIDVVKLPDGKTTIKIKYKFSNKGNRKIEWLTGKSLNVEDSELRKRDRIQKMRASARKRAAEMRAKRLAEGKTNVVRRARMATTPEVEAKEYPNPMQLKKEDLLYYSLTNDTTTVEVVPYTEADLTTNHINRAYKSLNRILEKARTLDPSTNIVIDAQAATNHALKVMNARLRKNSSGGYYYTKYGHFITYETALNFGLADYPTNEYMQATFDRVTQDPHSLWTKRQYFENYPIEGKQDKTIIKGSITPKNYN